MQRIRVYYSKKEELKYTGHLDLSKIWERYLRRAQLPLAYTEGFHPQPRINQALPLPLGMTSSAEIMDIWLTEPIELTEILNRFWNKPQPGLVINSIEEIDLKLPKIQTQVFAVEYTAQLLDHFPASHIDNQVKRLLESDEIIRQKRSKFYNLRPLIIDVHIVPSTETFNSLAEIKIKLTARAGATGRPDEVLAELSIQPYQTRIERTNIFIESSDL